MTVPRGTTYHVPRGGLPPQTQLTTERSRFTTAYAVLPARTMTDIVTSRLPFWTGMRMWVPARPLSGFAETFSQYLVEVSPGGGSDRPELDPAAEAVLFVVDGRLELTLDGTSYGLDPGGYAYLPPGADWTLHAVGDATATFHWLRKACDAVPGVDAPAGFVTPEQDVPPGAMPGADAW